MRTFRKFVSQQISRSSFVTTFLFVTNYKILDVKINTKIGVFIANLIADLLYF